MLGARFRRANSSRISLVLFAALVITFLFSSLLLYEMSTRAAARADTLSRVAAPTIARIASLHDTTLELQDVLFELVHPEHRHAGPAATYEARFEALAQRIRDELVRKPALPAEGIELLARFEENVTRTFAIARHDLARARNLLESGVLPTGDRLEDWQMQMIAENANGAAQAAADLQQIRGNVMALAYGSVAIAAMLLASSFLLLQRRNARRVAAISEYATLQAAKARVQESRADEMELFAGRVAHDIRNPLSTASLATELLEDQVTEEHARTLVVRLQRSLERAASITDGLLEFARAGASPEPGARTNVREAIDELAEAVAQDVSRGGIRLEIGPVPPVHVPCSPGVFASLLGNLVRNAMKYMGERDVRRIAVRGVDTGDAVRIEVSDTGPGIPEDVLPRLFEPYFRVAGKGHAGLGLGLPTVKKLVEGHGGRVGVKSQLGKGTTFWVELPYARALAEPSIPATAAAVC